MEGKECVLFHGSGLLCSEGAVGLTPGERHEGYKRGKHWHTSSEIQKVNNSIYQTLSMLGTGQSVSLHDLIPTQ